jgi:multicomponent Na+:H+ antiporter subunit G
MEMLLDAASWAFLIVGSAMLVIGGIGVVRLPDVFARMHGAGIIDTLGTCSILIGLMFQAGLNIVSIKLALIVVFIMFTSPTTTYALARAALNGGVRPRVETPPDDAPTTGAGAEPSKT